MTEMSTFLYFIRYIIGVIILSVRQPEFTKSENAFVNKTTYSSLPLYSITSTSGLAVDGIDYDPGKPVDEQCFMTSNVTQGGETCWFALDLEKQYILTSLMISLSYFSSVHSKLNAYGNLVNATIGITNTSPMSVTPHLDNYKICGRYGKPISSSSSTISIGCYTNNPSSRYVIIQQAEGAGGYLTICELNLVVKEVTEPTTVEMSTLIYTRVLNYDMNQPMFSRNHKNHPSTLSDIPNYFIINVRSDLECVIICLQSFKELCLSSIYRNLGKHCDMAKSINLPTGAHVIKEQYWLTAEILVF